MGSDLLRLHIEIDAGSGSSVRGWGGRSGGLLLESGSDIAR